MKKKVYITLQNGAVFQGYRFGADGNVKGELVFSTSMVGYVETLTNPSNYGQLIVQTFPLIGNYGVMKADMESEKAWANAYIVRENCDTPSNFRMEGTLDAFLKEQGVVGVYGVDTRQLTKILREEGAMNAYIGDKPLKKDKLDELKDFKLENAVQCVTAQERKVYQVNDAKGNLVLWDMGGKRSAVASLNKKGYSVTVLPAFARAEEVLAEHADGVVIGEGPGNPAENTQIIEEVKKVLGKTPVLGVGLGHQLVALALGGKTQKQKYGHRGANQPVKCVESGKVYISSQNHDYAVLGDTLTQGKVNFINVNDGSCEGVEYPALNALTVQFDPDSCGIGHTENVVFDAFFKLMKKERKDA